MLEELGEADARGEIAQLYDEMRRLTGVRYVSSMQRHLATRPGWIEWAWGAVRPAFASGAAQEAAWRLSETAEIEPLAPISREALRVLGLNGEDERSIRSICDNFIRVSPTNILFGGLLRRLLEGAKPSGAASLERDWTPPPPLDPLPSLVDLATIAPDLRALVMRFSVEVAGEPFVPGLYRLIARWPGFTAHVATVLGPRLDDPRVVEACAALAGRIDAEAARLVAFLPPAGAPPPARDEAEIAEIVGALRSYGAISPQLIVHARLIRNALPAPA